MNLNDRIGQWLIDVRQKSGTLASKCELDRSPIVTLSYAQTWDGRIPPRGGKPLHLAVRPAEQ